jgi:N6-adenosine-specific RNA methylase IME4
VVTEYRCILADPPWLERGGGKIKRGADRHYPLMHTPEIAKMMFRSGVWAPAADCHLWLWVTNNFLRHGLGLMETLGFRYVTNAVWVKDCMGLGQYLRGQHELLLFGVRGRLPSQSRSQSTLIRAPRREHSRKPDEAYEVIEAVSPGPRLEMFARTKRPGWDAWGMETEKF